MIRSVYYHYKDVQSIATSGATLTIKPRLLSDVVKAAQSDDEYVVSICSLQPPALGEPCMTTQVNGKSLDLPFTFGYAALRCTGRIFLDMSHGWRELEPAEFSEDIAGAARKGFNLLMDNWGISFVHDVQAQYDAFSAHRGYRLSLLRASLAQQRRAGNTEVSGTDCEKAIARISELLRSHRTWI